MKRWQFGVVLIGLLSWVAQVDGETWYYPIGLNDTAWASADTRVPLDESLEWAVADCDLIVRGRVVDASPWWRWHGEISWLHDAEFHWRVSGPQWIIDADPDLCRFQVSEALKGTAEGEIDVEGLLFGGKSPARPVETEFFFFNDRRLPPDGELLLFLTRERRFFREIRLGLEVAEGRWYVRKGVILDPLNVVVLGSEWEVAVPTKNLCFLHSPEAVLCAVGIAVEVQRLAPVTVPYGVTIPSPRDGWEEDFRIGARIGEALSSQERVWELEQKLRTIEESEETRGNGFRPVNLVPMYRQSAPEDFIGD